MSDRAPVGAPRRVDPERIAGVLDNRQAVLISDGADVVPVRCVADEVGDQHCLRLWPDHLRDTGDVDVERVGFDVDEMPAPPRPSPAARCPWRRSRLR